MVAETRSRKRLREFAEQPDKIFCRVIPLEVPEHVRGRSFALDLLPPVAGRVGEESHAVILIPPAPGMTYAELLQKQLNLVRQLGVDFVPVIERMLTGRLHDDVAVRGRLIVWFAPRLDGSVVPVEISGWIVSHSVTVRMLPCFAEAVSRAEEVRDAFGAVSHALEEASARMPEADYLAVYDALAHAYRVSI